MLVFDNRRLKKVLQHSQGIRNRNCCWIAKYAMHIPLLEISKLGQWEREAPHPQKVILCSLIQLGFCCV